MILIRTPYRVSMVGGGTDFPDFYLNRGGAVVSFTIDKYIYTLSVKGKNSNPDKFIKEVATFYGNPDINITTISDLPINSGLGGSSAYTIGIINAYHQHTFGYIGKEKLAQRACEVEIERLKAPIGKQDQYAIAYGGLNFIEFNKDGNVEVRPIEMSPITKSNLELNLSLFWVGERRRAKQILTKQRENINKDAKYVYTLHKMANLAKDMKRDLEYNNITNVPAYLDMNWRLKLTLSEGITNTKIDDLYRLALRSGAFGGKVVGAGGGGFMLLYIPIQNKRRFKTLFPLPEIDFKFDSLGSMLMVGD